ncbi:hypothetical protein GQF42_16050 [Streptomyces broussonetiae]|uniref:Uncharacterized protein n=1 Tax=Streptomyces broussonetiae TaxID=2686304 RepID=A0A6I6MW66_9ACTN|nr:hypothetical protein [Streptomyces broussonetiae]QHA04603.1 hypothetical protein GQF42_16050 [Streptomyces broussonetiae]
MQAELLAGLFGLGGTLVGAAVSTGAVVWQQRKTAHEAERAHLLGLAEAAANEVIRLSYELQDHFAGDVEVDPFSSEYWTWTGRLGELNRLLEQQALRFADPEVRHFLERIHTKIDHDPVRLREGEEGIPVPLYQFLCADLRTVMGTVLRRQPFPLDLWTNYPDASPSP